MFTACRSLTRSRKRRKRPRRTRRSFMSPRSSPKTRCWKISRRGSILSFVLRKGSPCSIWWKSWARSKGRGSGSLVRIVQGLFLRVKARSASCPAISTNPVPSGLFPEAEPSLTKSSTALPTTASGNPLAWGWGATPSSGHALSTSWKCSCATIRPKGS